MLKKNILHTTGGWLLTAVLALCFTACSNDLLDIEQPGVSGVNTYITADDNQVKQYISAVYSSILGNSYQSVIVGGGEPASYRSVLYEMSRMGAECAAEYQYNEASDANTYAYIYSYYYRQAYWCSMIIEHLPNNNVATESLKEQVIAEARAIRAIAMMNLVQLYGNPPLADHILDGSEGNTPASESWQFIENELKDAAEILPSKNSTDGQVEIGGRLTREAAYAYLGKAQLWQKKYDEAAQTLYNKVIATKKYVLVDNFATLNTSANDFSSENIWEYNFDDGADVQNSQDGSFDLACYSADLGVYSTTYGSLLMTFGMGAYPSKNFADFMTAHDMTTTGSSPRFQSTLADYPTALMSYQAMFMNYPYVITGCQGYYRVKDLCQTNDLVGTFPFFYSKRNVPYMRYAEVLLNYAEAVAEGGTPGPELSGLKALNLVRHRAGLTDAPSLSMNDASYGVKAERRAELFGEGQRFIDLVRWGDAATVLANCGKQTYTCTITQGETINVPGVGDITTYKTEVTTSETGTISFKAGKNELFPIPASDVNNNSMLNQNPGW